MKRVVRFGVQFWPRLAASAARDRPGSSPTEGCRRRRRSPAGRRWCRPRRRTLPGTPAPSERSARLPRRRRRLRGSRASTGPAARSRPSGWRPTACAKAEAGGGRPVNHRAHQRSATRFQAESADRRLPSVASARSFARTCGSCRSGPVASEKRTGSASAQRVATASGRRRAAAQSRSRACSPRRAAEGTAATRRAGCRRPAGDDRGS